MRGVPFGDLTHGEDGRRGQPLAALRQNCLQQLSRYLRVLVQPQDVLDGDKPAHRSLGLLRINVRHELESVAKPLAADAQPVVIGGR